MSLDLGITAIVQARMGSNRLPGKVLRDVVGESMLYRVLDRTRQAKLVSEVVLATSASRENQVLIELAENMGVRAIAYPGENDVLGRFMAACSPNTLTVVRITGDCPCIDPQVIDDAIVFYSAGNYDFVTDRPSYPDGADVEVMSAHVLDWMNKYITNPYHREHVTSFLYDGCAAKFNIGRMSLDFDSSNIKLSVDTEEDLERVRNVYRQLGPDFRLEDIYTLEEFGGTVAVRQI